MSLVALSKNIIKSFLYLSVLTSLILPAGSLCAAIKTDGLACAGCHTNPPYKKEEISTLKECLTCHGQSGHPYKEPVKNNSHIEITHHKKQPSLKDMVLIPSGEFIMGTDTRHKDEGPMHKVYLEDFYIDVYEVTVQKYSVFLNETDYPAPSSFINGGFPEFAKDHPVTFVSWYDAKNYCKWAGLRLPTESEWEKAARGTDGRDFPWGNDWNKDFSNNPIKESTGPEPVGSYENGKSPYGLYDMSGNVWEWVDESYHGHPGQTFVNPEYNESYKILKGGSWWNCMYYSCGLSAPVYNRSFFEPETTNNNFGFRCARDYLND